MKLFSPRLIRQLDSEAHLWLLDPATVTDSSQINSYLTILSEEESDRWRRFRNHDDRHTFLVSHAMLRCILSAYINRPAAGWTFELNPYGRPEITPSINSQNLRFNLSHTRGLIACLVCRHIDCGVDVEWLDRRIEIEQIVARMFTPSEQTDIQQRPDNERQRRFFEYWTLKEAYVKALGTGLSHPMHEFSMLISSDNTISVEQNSRHHLIDSWQFCSMTTSSRHVLATAIRHKQKNSHLKIISKTLTDY